MVEASIRSPRGLLQRLRRTFRAPGDVLWCLRIGAFLWRAPARMERLPLPEFLARQTRASRVPAAGIEEGIERIARLQGVWLRRRALRAHDTCYLRALCLFRFLDAGGGMLRIHFGVEPALRDGRRRGHAWVTVDGVPYGVPEGIDGDALNEILVFPPLDAGAEAGRRDSGSRRGSGE